MTRAGNVDVTILPRRRQGEIVPDPFLALGLRDHVQAYLKRRCLINVTPVVKLGKLVLGDQLLNKVRGKAITIHSQLITEFCQDYGVQPKTRGGLIKKAKNVGAALGFLS